MLRLGEHDAPRPAGAELAVAGRNGSAPIVESRVADYYGENWCKLRSFTLALTGDREAAEDIVQQAFAKTIVAARGGVEIADLSRWLHRVIRNLVADWHRCAARRPQEPLVEDLAADSRSDPRTTVELRARCAAVMDVLDRVPPRQRAALLLTSVLGLSYEETASVLGTSNGSIRQAVARARTAVRNAVDSGRSTFGFALLSLFGSRGRTERPHIIARAWNAVAARIGEVEGRTSLRGAFERVLHDAAQPATSLVAAAIVVSPVLLTGGPPADGGNSVGAGPPAPAPSLAAGPLPGKVLPGTAGTRGDGSASAGGERRSQPESAAPTRIAVPPKDVAPPVPKRHDKSPRKEPRADDVQPPGSVSDGGGKIEDVPARDPPGESEPEGEAPVAKRTIQGAGAGDLAGPPTAAAGDVNGEGQADVPRDVSRTF